MIEPRTKNNLQHLPPIPEDTRRALWDFFLGTLPYRKAAPFECRAVNVLTDFSGVFPFSIAYADVRSSFAFHRNSLTVRWRWEDSHLTVWERARDSETKRREGISPLRPPLPINPHSLSIFRTFAYFAISLRNLRTQSFSREI